MDKGHRLELSKRFWERVNESLATAKRDFASENYQDVPRYSYKAVSCAIKSTLAIDGFDSNKHSVLIAYFNRSYVKSKIFPDHIAALIDSSFTIKNRADYEGLYRVEREEAQSQINTAEEIISTIRPYLESHWAEMENK